MTKGRLEAFSDGVIAIIITIMVLELKVPHSTSWDAIKELIPVFISYILSFVFLGIYWGNHHHLLHTIRHVSSRILWANLHLLFWLSLIPFATAWMGETNFEKTTVIAYAILTNCCGVSYYLLLSAITRNEKENSVMRTVLQKQSRKGILSIIIYTAAIPAAYLHPVISCMLFVTVSVIWFIPDKNIEQAIHHQQSQQ